MWVRHGFRYTSIHPRSSWSNKNKRKKERKTKWKEKLQLDDGSSVLMRCHYVLLCKVFVCLLLLFLLGDHMIAKAYLQNSHLEFYCQMSARQQTHGKKKRKRLSEHTGWRRRLQEAPSGHEHWCEMPFRAIRSGLTFLVSLCLAWIRSPARENLPLFSMATSLVAVGSIFLNASFQYQLKKIPSRIQTAQRVNWFLGGTLRKLTSFVVRNNSGCPWKGFNEFGVKAAT